MAIATVDTAIAALLDKEMQKNYTHGILLHAQSRDRRIDYKNAVGNVDVNSPYFIASITKMYTIAIIMQLVDEGKTDLDAPVSTYLPSEMLNGIHVYRGTDYSSHLKVYQLIHQTSGLPDYFGDKRNTGNSLMDDIKDGKDQYWSIGDVLKATRDMSPKFPPDASDGKKSHYSDTNYQLLGELIEAVTGDTIANAYQKRIFDRLGLTDTYLYDDRHLREGNQPLLFFYKDTQLYLPKAMSSFRADGGIVSTLDDSMTFLRSYFDGELFSRGHFPRMTHRWNGIFFPLQYGYGLIRMQLPRWMTLFRYSPEFIGHSGASGSFAFYTPQEQVYLVGTFNQINAPNRPYQLMQRVINAIG